MSGTCIKDTWTKSNWGRIEGGRWGWLGWGRVVEGQWGQLYLNTNKKMSKDISLKWLYIHNKQAHEKMFSIITNRQMKMKITTRSLHTYRE